MNLYSLIPEDLFREMKVCGYIRTNVSPDGELLIHNYTEKAQFDRVWNTATMNCRGLITKADYPHEIVARPFPKFFNYGEEGHGAWSLDEPVVVTDKLDGSLGILYKDSSGMYQIATRGSFSSDQALHASHILNTKYHDFWVDSEWTLLFEIIYPENRIVVDYGKADDLYLVGAVSKQTGFVLGPESVPGWPGPRAELFTHKTLREALSAPVRPGKEGLVVRSLSDSSMVKIKQQEYVELHRIVTGLNEKAIWEKAKNIELSYLYLGVGDLVTATLEGIPDEMHDWVRSVVTPMAREVKARLAETQHLVVNNRDWGSNMMPRDERKQFAEKIKDRPRWQQTTAWLMFDYKDPREFLWKQLKPKEEK